MYGGMMIGGQLPYAGLGDDSSVLRAEITSTLRKLHGTAASIGDSKQRFAETGDQRFVQSVKNVLPYFKSLMTRLQQLYAMQGEGEMPSQFMLVLSDSSDWLVDNLVQPVGDVLKAAPKAVTALSNPLVLIALAGAAFVAFGGAKLLTKRA